MEKQAENIFCENIHGDSLIQLKDGRLLFYYFREGDNIYIYDSKSFRELFKIYLDKPKDDLEKENKSKDKENRNKRYYYLNKNSIKELDNGIILIGSDNYLFELNENKKSYECKIIKKMDDNILDINEISNKRLIIITDKKIMVLKKENLEYIIKDEYPIKDNWKIISKSSTRICFSDFNQYFSSYVLPNDKLLLNSFSTEISYNGGCLTHPPFEFSNSKFIFIDLINFEEITSTKTFEIDAKYMIFKNMILIQAFKKVIIYDINSFKIINNITLEKCYGYMYKYDEQYILTLSKKEEKNTLRIYKIENNDLKKYGKIKANLSFKKMYHIILHPLKKYNDKFLLILKDKRIIITCHNKMYLLKLDI